MFLYAFRIMNRPPNMDMPLKLEQDICPRNFDSTSCFHPVSRPAGIKYGRMFYLANCE